jgi:RAP1 GTPase activating protein 1
MSSKSADRKFKLELQLLNGELHEFEFSTRSTVDKVKEQIFNKVKSLSGASRLDYQLGFSPESRLAVEFVKFPECHEEVKKRFLNSNGEQVVIQLSLFPRSGKKLQRQMSVSALPNMRNATITHKKLSSFLGQERVFDAPRSSLDPNSPIPEPIRADLALVKEEVMGPPSPRTPGRRPISMVTSTSAIASAVSKSRTPASAIFSSPSSPSPSNAASSSAPSHSNEAQKTDSSDSTQTPKIISVTPSTTSSESSLATSLTEPSTLSKSVPAPSSPLEASKDNTLISKPETDDYDEEYLSAESASDEDDEDHRRSQRSYSFSAGETISLERQRIDKSHLLSSVRERSGSAADASLSLSTDSSQVSGLEDDGDGKKKKKKKLSRERKEKSPSRKQLKALSAVDSSDGKVKKEKKDKEKEKEKKSKRNLQAQTSTESLTASLPSPKGSKRKLEKSSSAQSDALMTAVGKEPKEKVKRKKSTSTLDSSIKRTDSESSATSATSLTVVLPSGQESGPESPVSPSSARSPRSRGLHGPIIRSRDSLASIRDSVELTESQLEALNAKVNGASSLPRTSSGTLNGSSSGTNGSIRLSESAGNAAGGTGNSSSVSGLPRQLSGGLMHSDSLDRLRDLKDLADLKELLDGPTPPDFVTRGEPSPSGSPYHSGAFSPTRNSGLAGGSQSPSSRHSGLLAKSASNSATPPSSSLGSRNSLDQGQRLQIRGSANLSSEANANSGSQSYLVNGAPSSPTDEGPIDISAGEREEDDPVAQLRLSDDDYYSTMRRGSRMAIQTRNRSNSLLANDLSALGGASSRARFEIPGELGFNRSPSPGPSVTTTHGSIITSSAPIHQNANGRLLRGSEGISMATASSSSHQASSSRDGFQASSSGSSSSSSSNTRGSGGKARPSFAEMRSGSFSIETANRSKVLARMGANGVSGGLTAMGGGMGGMGVGGKINGGMMAELAEDPEILLELESRRRAAVQRGSVRPAPPLMKPCRGFWVEVGRESLTPDLLLSQVTFPIENAADEKLWYAGYFASHPHYNYIGSDASGDPFVLSVIKPQGANMMRVLLRTRRGDERQVVAESKETAKIFKSKIPVQDLMRLIAPSLTSVKMRAIKDLNLIYDLMNFEERLRVNTYKFGILLCKEGQTKEEEMFSNEYGSEQYEAFLSMLGETVALKGWEKFKGGLDVERESTGSHSVYTQFEGNEIMFHVSTMLPFSTDNPQQLERKRHLGNDIVILVFKEGNTPYIPNTISSEFIHVIGIVQPEIINDRVKYRFSIASKDGVPTFSPSLPASGLFDPGQAFRNLILTKLINGERAAYKSPAFAGKMQRTRQIMLKDLDSRYK